MRQQPRDSGTAEATSCPRSDFNGANGGRNEGGPVVPLLLPPDSEWKPSSYSVLGPARLSPPHRSDSPGPLPPPWLPCPPEPWASQGQAYPRAFLLLGKLLPPPQRFSGLLPLHHFLRAIPRTPLGEQDPHHILHTHCPSPAFLPTKALARTARPSLPLMYVHGSIGLPTSGRPLPAGRDLCPCVCFPRCCGPSTQQRQTRSRHFLDLGGRQGRRRACVLA